MSYFLHEVINNFKFQYSLANVYIRLKSRAREELPKQQEEIRVGAAALV